MALLMLFSPAYSQLLENFDQTAAIPGPPWKGTDTAWKISDGRLQSSSLQPGSRFYLHAPAGIPLPASWEWWVQLDHRTSGVNYTEVYLMADSSNLLSPAVSGYFVRIGDTGDEVSLYKKLPDGATIQLINGRDGLTGGSSAMLRLKVTCDATQNWQLWTDTTGTGRYYTLQGSAQDGSFTLPLCLGIVIRQSTASFFGKHFFDEIRVVPLAQDTAPPPPPPASAARYEVLITEIMSDPEPVLGLPPVEYIEIRHTGSQPLQLQHWQLTAGGKTVLLPAAELAPDSLLLLCRKEPAALLGGYGRVLALDRFPALGNGSDTLVLSDAGGRVIHAVAYDKSLYAASGQEKGGRSLEMISTAAPCNGSDNWKPAVAAAGGTPGIANSVAAEKEGTTPDLLRIHVSDSTTLRLYFSKAMDSALAANPAHYHLEPATTAAAGAALLPPLFNTVQLHLSLPLQQETVYTLTVNSLADCRGEPTGIRNSAELALPAAPDSTALAISELLFDPRPPAPEFIELYNGSKSAVDLQQVYLSLTDEAGTPAEKIPLSREPRLLLPQQYLAFTRSPADLCSRYSCKAPENVLFLGELPVLPNEEGHVALYNASGQVLDRVYYSRRMHFPLAGNTGGVSLERLDMKAPAGDTGNWHDAASTAGYATPGSMNSQQLPQPRVAGAVTVQPPVFSPDNDGIDDLALITCRMPQGGMVGNIIVFNAQGRPVRRLLQNGLLGSNSNPLVWDGLGENKQALPVGIYIIFTEIFDLQGRVQRWKLPVVMARKLK